MKVVGGASGRMNLVCEVLFWRLAFCFLFHVSDNKSVSRRRHWEATEAGNLSKNNGACDPLQADGNKTERKVNLLNVSSDIMHFCRDLRRNERDAILHLQVTGRLQASHCRGRRVRLYTSGLTAEKPIDDPGRAASPWRRRSVD